MTFLSKTPAFDRIPPWPHNTYLHQSHHMICTVQLASSLSFVFGIRVCVVCTTTYTLPSGGPVIFAPPSIHAVGSCEGAERGINPCHTHTHTAISREKLFLCVIDAGANLRTAKMRRPLIEGFFSACGRVCVLWHTLQNAAGMFKNETFWRHITSRFCLQKKSFFFSKVLLRRSRFLRRLLDEFTSTITPRN